MPIFEYRCKKCDQEFEALVLGGERAKCPSCRSASLEKLLSTFSAVSAGGRPKASEPRGPCGTCGDPRGPGSCSMN